MSEVPDGSFVIKSTFMNEYSGILLSTFIHVSTILRYLYIQYMICFYKCTAWKKKIFLVISTALNITNMGQPYPNWRPRESKADNPVSSPFPAWQPDGPSTGKSVTLCPCGLRRPACPWHLHSKCPFTPSPNCRGWVLPEGKWQRGMYVSGMENRNGRNVLFY